MVFGSILCTLYGHSDFDVGIFFYVFTIIPRKFYTIFQPTFSQSNATRLLILSTNSVTKKIVICTVYFYDSGPVFATKRL